MTKISFSPEFLLYTSGLSEVQVEGKTVSDCLVTAFNRFPQLLVFLTRNKEAEALKTSIKLNNEFIFDPSDLWISVNDDDCLEFGRDIPEGESSGIKVIVGTALIVAALVAAPFTAGTSLSALPSILGMMGASLVFGGLSEMIATKPTLPGDYTGTSPTYQSFSGIQNTTTPGTPVGLIYGTHRVGGHILTAHTSYTTTTQYLSVLLGLSEGEVEYISDVEINKVGALEYVGIWNSWRPGTRTQEAPVVTLLANTDPGVESSKNGYVLTTNLHPISIGTYLTELYGTHIIYSIPNDKLVNYVRVGIVLNGEGGSASVWLTQNDMVITDRRGVSCGFKDGRFAPNVYFDLLNYTHEDIVVHVLSGDSSFVHFNSISMGDYYYNIYTGQIDSTQEQVGFTQVQSTTSIGQVVSFTGVVTTTSIETQSVVLSLEAPALYSENGTKGTSVEVSIQYRDTNILDSAYCTPISATIASDLPTKSVVFRNVDLAFPSISTWEIKITRVTADYPSDIGYQGTVSLSSITENQAGGFIYPHTALLGLKIQATDQLSGSMPTITSLVKGIKVALPDTYNGQTRTWSSNWTSGNLTYNYDPTTGIGSGTKAWTDNLVWCLYDLISNKRYGLGDYFKISPSKKGLMLANFVTMSDYCDEVLSKDGTLVSDPTERAAAVASIRSGVSDYRFRFSLNVVIDESKSAIEWLNTICACMRASLYYTEGCVYIDIDRPKNITQIFTMSSITEYSQSRSSRSGVPNTYELQFIDKNKNYEPQILTIEDPEFQQDPTIEQRSKTLQLRGVTDEQQARSLTKYALYAGKYARTSVSFKTGTQGLRSMVGDVIGVQHDVPQWGAGGRIKGCVVGVGGTLNLTLDNEFFTSGTEALSVMISQVGYAPEVVAITEVAGTSNILNIQPPVNFTPAAGDEYIIGLASNTVKTFRIVSLKRDPDELINVTAVEYNATLYPACDNIEDTGGVSQPMYQQLAEPTRLSVTNIYVNERVYQDSAGIYKSGAVVTYTIPTSSFWAGAYVCWGIGAYSTQEKLDQSGYVEIKDISVAGSYQFVVVSQYKDGSRQSTSEALADAVNHPFTTKELAPLGPTPTELATLSVATLQLENTPGSTEFVGKDACFTWEPPGIVNNAGGLAQAWLSGYTVDIYNANSSIRRTSFIAEPRYVYTYESNRADAAAATRAFGITVTAMDSNGQEFVPTSLEVSNVAPAAL